MNQRRASGVIAALAVIALTLLLARWPAGASALSADDGDDALWRSSEAPPDTRPLQRLSPPDSVHVQRAAGADEPVQAPEGVVLRDFRLPGSVFRPRASSVGYYWGAGGGCIYNTSGNAGEIWNAPVTLPEGATINTVRMYYDDRSEQLNATGWISIYDLYGALVEEWEMTSSGAGGEGFDDTPLVDHTIDYSVYSYALNWRPLEQGSDMQLCGFRIFYEAPPFGLSFLPRIANNE